MPWDKSDVEKHKKGLSDKQKDRWVQIANSALKACLEKGGEQESCEVSAIKQANGIVGNIGVIAFSCNLELKKEMFDGKEHLVVPVVALTEGVHHGSGGAVYYPLEEIRKSLAAWNGVPVPVYHPKAESGDLISANSPSVIEKMVVGRFFNAYLDDAKMKGEIWIDIEKANKISPEFIAMLNQNKKVEVSTSLFTDCDNIVGTWNGEEYIGTVSNFRPDHIAVLPYQKGACSWEDGCGIRLNTTNVVANSVKVNSEEKDMDRKEVIDKMLGNAEFCKDAGLTEENRQWLEGLEDAHFNLFQNVFTRIAGCECQNPKEEKKIENESSKKKEEVVPVTNAKTADEFIANAPEEFKEVLSESLRMHKQKKNDIVKELLGNKRNKFTQEELEAKGMRELEILSELANIPVTYSGRNFTDSSSMQLKYNERHPDGSGIPDMPEIDWTKN